MTNTVLDLSAELDQNLITVVDIGLYDYFVIQVVNSTGNYNVYTSNDGGAIPGVRDGGISPKFTGVITQLSTQVTDTTTKYLEVGDRVVGRGISANTFVASITNDTEFILTQVISGSVTSGISTLEAIYVKNFIPAEVEDLSAGTKSVSITVDGNYRGNAPLGKYLIIDAGSPGGKVLLYLSKIY